MPLQINFKVIDLIAVVHRVCWKDTVADEQPWNPCVATPQVDPLVAQLVFCG